MDGNRRAKRRAEGATQSAARCQTDRPDGAHAELGPGKLSYLFAERGSGQGAIRFILYSCGV